MSVHFINLSSPDAATFLGRLRSSGTITALLGSAISDWEPSNLPSGLRITQELANLIAASPASPKDTILKLLKNTPFEAIMERYPMPEIINKTVAEFFYPSNKPTMPNPIHKAFAHLVETGVIQNIITPNYDMGLEEACKTICSASRMPKVIIEEKDGKKHKSLSQPVIFKIHGCASPGREKTMILTLRQEGVMPLWKKDLLASIINGKPLLVCGYSGLDFEICPELLHLNIPSVIWNSYNDPRVDKGTLTSNANRVLSKKNSTVLIGDMKVMLGNLTGFSCEAGRPVSSPSFISDLTGKLDEWEMDKWRVWVLNGASCSLDGIKIANRMFTDSGASVERKIDSLIALGEACFHGGLYFQSRAAYNDASVLSKGLIPKIKASAGRRAEAKSQPDKNDDLIENLSKSIQDDLERLWKAEVGAIEADRGSGHYLRARNRIKKAAEWLIPLSPPNEREKVESELNLKKILLERYFYFLYKKLRLKLLINKKRDEVRGNLAQVAEHFAENGSWINLQQCEMLAKRFDLQLSDIYSGTMTPMETHQGFNHLGYILAEMMGYRSLLADAKVINPPLRVDYLKTAEEIGINPETWKLFYAIEKKFGKNTLSSQDKVRMRQARNKCEYTVLMKMLLFVRGSEL